MKIQDNYLDSEEFNKLREFIIGNKFPWYYSDGVVHPGDGRYQLTNLFETGDSLNILTPLLFKMGVTKISRIKANWQAKTDTIIENPFHTDGPVVCKTSIFYINTCDGYTKFENGDIVNSVANRLVTFPSQTKHCGTTCTNASRRIVINFNYFT
tara:strand:+ start:75 stop:536 length:462 start_codon:yes stop_codon:yes gene_type:complete